MSNRLRRFAGVLLVAAPLFAQSAGVTDPTVDKTGLHWFQLNETKAEVARLLGAPKSVASFGEDLEAWQYQIGVVDDHEFSHQLVFRRSTGKLISAARNYETDRDVEPLFPAGQDKVYWFAGNPGAKYGVRVLRLADGRVLLAPGSSAPGKPASQLLLIREAEVKFFFPWLALQLENVQQK
jgi:hypothetical protein